MFFRTLRLVMGPFMLLWEKLTTPKGIQRPLMAQQQVDQATEALVLYEFRTCPFCIKVRREINRLSLKIERRDAQKNPVNREQLLQGGGKIKVPCLRVTEENGQVSWLYESSAIIDYLQRHYA